MEIQLVHESRSGLAGRWRKPWVVTALVTIALLAGVHGNGSGQRAEAASPLLHDVVVVPIDDGFEADATFTGGECDNCADYFHRVTSDAHTGSLSYYAPDTAAVSSVTADSPWIVIPSTATAADLTFWQRFEFEHTDSLNYDGGVLELQVDDSQSPWMDAQARITAGGYRGTLAAGSPLAGRAAWVGDSGGWHQVAVDLSAYRGQTVRFHLLLGTDQSNNSPAAGWWVDDVRLTYRASLTACRREWATLTSHPRPVLGAAVAASGADLYAFGGAEPDETGTTTVAAAYRYSTENDDWIPIAPLPAARYAAGAVSDGRYIYILGGSPTLDRPAASTVWRYDPAANSYLTLAPLQRPTASHSAVYLNGTIYKIGGQADPDPHTFTSAVEAYSVVNNSWSTVADYPQTVGQLAAVAIDGYIYTAGGVGESTSYFDTYRYDPAADTWDTAPIADLPADAGIASGAFYNGTWIVTVNHLFLGWDPPTNTWRSLDQASGFLTYPALSAGGSRVFALGPETFVNETEIGLLQYAEGNCACSGDCDGDEMVTVSELVKGVGIALRLQPLGSCNAFDDNGDGNVAINELVAAVGNALHGCGGG
jgi:hypothetical protein